MATLDPTELLQLQGWLRQLARTLVHEGAEDLVQDTWVAALRRPPDTTRGLRPWLRTTGEGWKTDGIKKSELDALLAEAKLRDCKLRADASQ